MDTLRKSTDTDVGCVSSGHGNKSVTADTPSVSLDTLSVSLDTPSEAILVLIG